MALNIPMPDLPGTSLLKGLDTGSTLMTRMMQPVLEREKQRQAALQFQQGLALKKQAMGRAAALDPLRRQIMEQQLLSAQHKNDPMWELNQYKNMFKLLSGQDGSSQGSQQIEASEPPPDLFGGQEPNINLIPKNTMGLNEDTLSNIMPDSLSQMPDVPDMPVFKPVDAGNNNGNDDGSGFNLDALKQNPMLRAFFKHKFKFDPLATPAGETLSGPAREASDLEKIRKERGEDSPEYKMAKQIIDANIGAKKDLSDKRHESIYRTEKGLKTGEKEFFDPDTGVALGKEIPLSVKEREEEQGAIFFDKVFPIINHGASPFSGEGSINRLEQAAANYKTDPKARKMLDDYALAEKLITAGTVSEASTLRAGHTNQTYNRIQSSLEASDIPNIVKKLVKQYQLPASFQLKAGERFQKVISDTRREAKKLTPATQKLFYDPQKQAQHEAEMSEGAPQTVKMYKGNDEYDIPADQVKDAEKEGYKRG